jgi:hypothetical protein
VARGKKATLRQKVAGRHNLMKAQIMRIGARGMRYRRRLPRGYV